MFLSLTYELLINHLCFFYTQSTKTRNTASIPTVYYYQQ